MTPQANGSISPVSTLIVDVVGRRVDELVRAAQEERQRADADADASLAPIGATAMEFDDVRLGVHTVVDDTTGKPVRDALDVSIAGVRGGFDGETSATAARALAGAYGDVRPTPNATYDLTLRVRVGEIAKIEDASARRGVIEDIGRLRLAVYGSKLREHLRRLAESGTEGPLDWVPHRPGETMFIKPQHEQVTVVFPMRFADARDAVIANTFLAQFVEVRRGQSALSTAPAVSYHKSPPLELKDAPAGTTNALNANGGYVSFVFFKRHVVPERLEATVWNIMTFYAFVSYHIKYSKAYWHSRMRRKVDEWLMILKRAKKADPNAAKKMTTASGRTFVRTT
jgi:actin related protein 2/3 complex, subunit 2